MTDLEEKAQEYIKKLEEEGFACFSCFDCKYAEKTGPMAGFKSGVPDKEFFDKVEQAFKDGYKEAEKDLICKLADFLHISLTFENPIEVFDKIVEK